MNVHHILLVLVESRGAIEEDAGTPIDKIVPWSGRRPHEPVVPPHLLELGALQRPLQVLRRRQLLVVPDRRQELLQPLQEGRVGQHRLERLCRHGRRQVHLAAAAGRRLRARLRHVHVGEDAAQVAQLDGRTARGRRTGGGGGLGRSRSRSWRGGRSRGGGRGGGGRLGGAAGGGGGRTGSCGNPISRYRRNDDATGSSGVLSSQSKKKTDELKHI